MLITIIEIKELKDIAEELSQLFKASEKAFRNHSFESMIELLNLKQKTSILVDDKIQRQIERTRKDESSPKNTTLYFSLLTETNDVLNVLMRLLKEYYSAHDGTVKPVTFNDR